MSAEDNSPVPDYLKRGRVDGRNYVVLGGGLGMGRQTVHALSQAGASRVMVVDIDRARADGVAAEISGGLGWSGDITKREEVKRLVTESASAFGRVHGIVDIVGMAQWAALLDLSDSMLERDLDINFRHAFLASQEFARHMIDNGGGTMVFIASVSGGHGVGAGRASQHHHRRSHPDRASRALLRGGRRTRADREWDSDGSIRDADRCRRYRRLARE